MMYEKEELIGAIDSLFNPEVDEDGFVLREYPHPRITNHHHLDISYMNSSPYEGLSTHRYTRRCGNNDEDLHLLDRNMDVAIRLFESGLRLFADSIVAYYGKKDRKGPLRFYPPIIQVFWSGFEAFVRYSSELMLITVKDVPERVRDCLLDQETVLDEKAEPKIQKNKFQPVLKRYAALLRHGYSFNVNRGDTYWQNLEAANNLRDYYTHVGMRESKAITSKVVIDFMENVMMGIITPSCKLNRTLLLWVYRLYDIWAELREKSEDYVEEPFFRSIAFDAGYLFHCNFENVDKQRFPNWDESRDLQESA